METKNNSKSRNFVFTLYNVSESKSDLLINLYDKGFANLLIFTHELGNENENPHIQGYMRTVQSNRLMNVKKKINELFDFDPNPHIEIARGTSYQNYVYITKELKENPHLKHVIKGGIPLPPGKKRDDSKFESYVSLLEKGEITLKQIEEEDLAHYVRHEAHYLSVKSKLLKRAVRHPPFICWFSGSTGTGKSYTAQQIANHLGFDVYDAGCENNFFNPYNGEDCSIWDDYRSGPITFATLLKITDRNGCMINIKGGKVFFSPKIQIFTSPEGLDSAKTNEMKNSKSLDNKFDQLKRRIHYTINFKSSNANTIPTFEEVKKTSEIVKMRCLGAYKYFLEKEGFGDFIPFLNLENVKPIKFKNLIESDPKTKIAIKDNCE